VSNPNWQEIERVFYAILDRPPLERVQALEELCAGNPGLRREIESLLAYDDRAESSLTRAVHSGAAEVVSDADPAGDPIGMRLGVWEVVEPIGAGGMGAVYRARRVDGQFRQEAALKIVRRGMDTEAVLERFRRERQILAGLQHPYIARLLDGGTTPDGLPYFVMELVDGCPIDRYCDDHELTVAQRIELMLVVCDAVAHAHRNLIIHRDLKPGNILVTAEGAPKLLDFGVAGILTDGHGVDAATQLAAPRPYTPDYASPEQVRGEPLNVATDVYSLGAVLFELLCGARPHRITTYTPQEVAHAVCDAEPERPSAAAVSKGEKARARELRGDLDNIVLMAMRKEPERRYDSPLRLREDLERYLAGLPVLAQPDSFRYRAGKFVRRRRWALAAAGVLVMSLIAGLAGTLWQARQAGIAREAAERATGVARAERDRAEQRRLEAVAAYGVAEQQSERARLAAELAERRKGVAEQRLEQLVELANKSLFDIHGEIETLPGATEARRRIAAFTLEFLDGLARDAAGDPAVDYLLATAYRRVGDVLGLPLQPNLGDTKGALASYRKADAIFDRLLASAPDQRLRMGRLAVRDRIAYVREANGAREEAENIWRQLLVEAQVIATAPGATNQEKLQPALMHDRMARSLAHTNVGAALDHGFSSLAILQRLHKAAPADLEMTHELSSGHSTVGTKLQTLGQLTEALDHYLEAARLRESILKVTPDNVHVKRNLVLAWAHVGEALTTKFYPNLRRPADALPHFERALELAQQLRAADPKNRLAQTDLSACLIRKGDALRQLRRFPEAIDTLRQAAAILEPIAAADPKRVTTHLDLALIYEYMARSRNALGEREQALELVRRADAAARKALEPDPDGVAGNKQLAVDAAFAAEIHAQRGERLAAFDLIRSARAIFNRLDARYPGNPSVLSYQTVAVKWEADVLSALGDVQQARDGYERMLSTWSTLPERSARLFPDEVADAALRLAQCERTLRAAAR
jgi:serine/threonine protein kinase